MRPGWAQALLVSSAVLAGAHGSAGCFWDRGQPSPAPGLRCRDWLNAQSRPPGPPPDAPSRAPPAPSPRAPEERPLAPGSDDGRVFAPADALPARSEAAAVRPVTGIGRRAESKEKKDLGTLGYVLGITMTAVIVAIGAGVVLGYTYKRGKDLQQQREQKVQERELQRITLPLSAFSNPACEVVDEKTVVVHSGQTPVDPREGSAPLMARAGTPGA